MRKGREILTRKEFLSVQKSCNSLAIRAGVNSKEYF